ncbi:MAG: transporter substrate-binding domain-containing protein, partial [Lachnospiraceae bacterium]|nr:transporter substrate-binding domain-containing protein [Lachnospiraceae bacterium]
SGRVDVIFANITGNLERAKTINFSMPYLRTGIKMATRADLEGVDVVADLNSPDYTVAVASGSTGEQLVLEMAPNCNISYVASFADQCLALQEGKADAIFEDGTSIDYMAGQNDYMTAESMVYTSDPICVGYAKGDADFARYIDMFVSYMITSGWQKETYYKWFGSEYTGTLSTIW